MREGNEEHKKWFVPAREAYGILSQYAFSREAWLRCLAAVRARHDKFVEDDKRKPDPDADQRFHKFFEAMVDRDNLVVTMGFEGLYEVEFTFRGEDVEWQHF